MNKHSSHDDPLFNKCGHGEIHARRWLRVGMLIPKENSQQKKKTALDT